MGRCALSSCSKGQDVGRGPRVAFPGVPNEGAVGYQGSRLFDHLTGEEQVAIGTDKQDRLPDPRQNRSRIEQWSTTMSGTRRGAGSPSCSRGGRLVAMSR